MCTLRHLLRTLLLVAVPAHQLAAQQIGGTVVDIVTGEPVPAVTVELFDPASTVVASVVADDAGEFVISIPAPGAYRIGTRHAGYQDARSASLELEAQDTLTVQYRIAPEVVVLNPLTVVASSRRQPGHLSGFEERARRGVGGQFILREEIEPCAISTTSGVPAAATIAESCVRSERSATNVSAAVAPRTRRSAAPAFSSLLEPGWATRFCYADANRPYSSMASGFTAAQRPSMNWSARSRSRQ